MRSLAKEHGFDTSEDSRCFVLNGDLVLLVQAIDIGTRPSNIQMDGPAAEDDFENDNEAVIILDENTEDTTWSGDVANLR
jgi:hypothetical protein